VDSYTRKLSSASKCLPSNKSTFVFRPLAWNLVRPISNELQVLLQQERLALGLITYNENPLSQVDNDMYNETMRVANDQGFVLTCKFFSICCHSF